MVSPAIKSKTVSLQHHSTKSAFQAPSATSLETMMLLHPSIQKQQTLAAPPALVTPTPLEDALRLASLSSTAPQFPVPVLRSLNMPRESNTASPPVNPLMALSSIAAAASALQSTPLSHHKSRSTTSTTTGIYYQNRALPQPPRGVLHPLQTTRASSPLQHKNLKNKTTTGGAALPNGKPLLPAPALGHLQTIIHKKPKGGARIHFQAPVKVSKSLPKHRLPTKKSKQLNAEERLFVEAAVSLKKATSPPSKKGLPPPPFHIAFAA